MNASFGVIQPFGHYGDPLQGVAWNWARGIRGKIAHLEGRLAELRGRKSTGRRRRLIAQYASKLAALKKKLAAAEARAAAKGSEDMSTEDMAALDAEIGAMDTGLDMDAGIDALTGGADLTSTGPTSMQPFPTTGSSNLPLIVGGVAAVGAVVLLVVLMSRKGDEKKAR